MKIQLNSDNTIAVDAGLTRFVEGEVSRALVRFATGLTRVEVHLSGVDNRKPDQAVKRCLIEVRPKRAQPLIASAKSKTISAAVGQALSKMRRSLTTFFGRKERPSTSVPATASTAKNTVTPNATVVAKKRATVKKQIILSPRGPKKKWTYQARRKSWPAR